MYLSLRFMHYVSPWFCQLFFSSQEVELHEDSPTRKIYTITEKGRKVFRTKKRRHQKVPHEFVLLETPLAINS